MNNYGDWASNLIDRVQDEADAEGVELTADQKLAKAQGWALLSVAEELEMLNNDGLKVRGDPAL